MRWGVPVEKRFFHYVNKTADGCWLWKGKVSDNNPKFRLTKHPSKVVGARKFSWELVKDKLPPKRRLETSCGNWHCVNPDHLQITTPEKRLELMRRGRLRLRAIILDFKKAGCVRCGYNQNSAALDCHHKDPKIKSYEVSKAQTAEKLLLELAKCEVLCANCHRIEHATEQASTA